MANYTHSEITDMAADLEAVKNWPKNRPTDIDIPGHYQSPAVISAFGNNGRERSTSRQ
jgi:hypothetical protein